MKTSKKVWIGSAAVAAVAVIVGFSIRAQRQDPVAVETGKVERRDELIARVSATGEIQPKNFVELQSEIAGVITELRVREGDRVAVGDILLRIDPIQTEAETRAQEALLEAALAEARGAQSQISVQRTNVGRDESDIRVAEAELERARQNLIVVQNNFDRKQQLFEDELIARDAYEAARNELAAARAALITAEARLQQSKAQLEVSQELLKQAQFNFETAQSRIKQQRALLERNRDLLSKTILRSPLAGVITQMNVEAGERAVPGTLNNPAATLMVIADLSEIEAELEVDETDIVDVEVGQPAIIKVDALPNRPLPGRVTEVGSSALTKSSQDEAKDFKVVVQLEDPPAQLRPGLSCTAEITTSIRRQALVIPIQALTVREFAVDEKGGLVRAAAKDVEGKDTALGSERKEFEGVFVVRQGKAEFVPAKTGITGDTLIEVTEGLEEGMTIVTGSYKTLRTLEDGDSIRIENEKG